MEKAQVSALARFLGRMLAELERPGELPSGAELALEPFDEPDFVVRSLGVSYDEDSDRIILVADEVDRTEAETEVESCSASPTTWSSKPTPSSDRSVRAVDDPGAGRGAGHPRDRARRGGPAALPALRVSARRERPRVPEDERPPPAADLSGPAWLELLA